MKNKFFNNLKNNKFFNFLSYIEININESSSNKIYLSDLLKNKVNNKKNNLFNIKIILKNGVKITLIDDLFLFNINKSSLNFILNENSYLDYQLSILSENKNCKVNLILEKNLKINFIGKFSQAFAKCIFKGTKNRFFKIKTLQNHIESNTFSDLLIKAALSNKSKIFTDNLVVIEKNLNKVQAKQISKALLLGCKSHAICVPKLEVQSDDVDCIHGAAVSKMDESQLFYLQSRGLDFCNAKNLLMNAFLNI